MSTRVWMEVEVTDDKVTARVGVAPSSRQFDATIASHVEMRTVASTIVRLTDFAEAVER